MRVFLTGASGFIGSHVTPLLLARGHQVLGLARSDASAAALEQAGAEVHRGDLEQPETLKAGAEQADAVIHCAFDHNFATFVANTQKDRRNIAAMGEALAETTKPILITSGVGIGAPLGGGIATEDVLNPQYKNPRVATELAGAALTAQGIDVRTIRLPQVHDTEKAGLISPLIDEYRRAGVAAYVGEGTHRWSAAHVSDVAELYVLALEKGQPTSRYNASAEEGVSQRDVAEVLGKGLNLPVQSVGEDQVQHHFGWMAIFATADMTASNALTRERLGWAPKGPTLLEDLAQFDFAPAGD